MLVPKKVRALSIDPGVVFLQDSVFLVFPGVVILVESVFSLSFGVGLLEVVDRNDAAM